MSQKKQLTTIRAWVDDHSQSALARLSGVSSTVISRLLAGRYPGDRATALNSLCTAIENYNNRAVTAGAVIETSVYKLAHIACQSARQSGGFAVLAGRVGTGKTYALRDYARTTPRTFFIEPDCTYSIGVLIDDLIEQFGISVTTPSGKRAGLSVRMRELTRALKGTDSLVIVDEAELMTEKQLELIRRLRDKAGVGVVLAGTDRLDGLLRPHHGQFEQIRSRVSLWPDTIAGITHDDCVLTIEQRLGAVDIEVHNVLWDYCAGSMRVLCEMLITSLKRLADAGNEISGALVHSVADKLLNLKKAA